MRVGLSRDALGIARQGDEMAMHSGSERTVYAALAGNLLIAVTKFIAAALTGSSAILSEGVHSLIDTGNELLLLYGLRRAALPPDPEHPFGHGRELYFWSFIVALLLFALGAGVSFYEGIMHIRDPRPVENVMVSYVVLALSAIFEGLSWRVAFKEFNRRRGNLGFFAAVHQSKDPTAFTVLFEDTAALAGIFVAFIGIFAAQILEMPELDGLASIGISVILAVTAVFLARESKGLLIGEPASRKLEAAILEIAGQDYAIRSANGVLTVHLAPDQIVAALSAEFEDNVSVPDVEACIVRLERRLRSEHPEITVLFVKPQTSATWQAWQAELEAAEDSG
jgi:cation diffusion facilitator family transporter